MCYDKYVKHYDIISMLYYCMVFHLFIRYFLCISNMMDTDSWQRIVYIAWIVPYSIESLHGKILESTNVSEWTNLDHLEGKTLANELHVYVATKWNIWQVKMVNDFFSYSKFFPRIVCYVGFSLIHTCSSSIGIYSTNTVIVKFCDIMVWYIFHNVIRTHIRAEWLSW